MSVIAPSPPAMAWMHITRMTLREAVRRKLVLTAIVLSVAFLGLFTLGIVLLDRNPDAVLDAAAASVLASLGLYALHFLAAFLALTVGIGSVSVEVDSGALLALLARPLSRRSYLLGRWAALALLVVAYVTLMGFAILAIARLAADFAPISAPRAVALIGFEAVLLLTVAVYGSTRWTTVANGVVVFSLFALSWIAGFIEFIGAVIGNAGMTNTGIAVSLLFPADALWRGASYYSQAPALLADLGPIGIPLFGSAPPAPALLGWALIYIALILFMALRRFTQRDL